MKIILFWIFVTVFSFLFAEHWEVQVFLKNGSTLKGFVLEDRFVEEFVEDTWIVVPQNKKTAGLRLWFVADSDGFIVLPYRQILQVERIRTISDQELEALQIKYLPQDPPEKKVVPENEVPPQKNETESSKAKETPPSEESSFEEERKRYYSLLLEQFPTHLWNLSYVRNLIRTQVLNEIPVSQKYREFLEVYDDWKMAQEVQLHGAPIQYSVEECEAILEQYQNLLKRFPPDRWDLVKLGDRAREYSVKGKILTPHDLEFFANYDNWSRAKKALESLRDGSAQAESKKRQTLSLEKKSTDVPVEKKETTKNTPQIESNR